jgi:hypothetical protein
MRSQPLDTIRQIKPPSRCTDEELIDRLMQGEFFKLIKGRLAPSPVEVMRAGPRSKQEARTIIRTYEERTNSGGGREHRAPDVALPESRRLSTVTGESGHVAHAPPETKPKTPVSEIIARVIAFISEKSIALGVGGLGVWLAYIQLGINYEFWRSQGQSLGAKDQFGYVGIIIEILLMALLPARRILRKRSEGWWSFVVLLGVSFCWAASTYASWNFAARNIDDGAARRQDATQKIAKLQTERDDFARLQIIHARDGRLNAARLDGDQIQSRESQIRELQPKAGTTAPDVYNLIGKGFYTGIPTLSMTLVMIGFLGLTRREDQGR